MFEKLILALGLTFALSLFAELNLSASKRTVKEINQEEPPALLLSHQQN
jgi:hypothetical protein